MPDLDADALLRAMGDELIEHGDPDSALRRMMQQGLDVDGQHLQGIREILERLREARRERLERDDLGGVFAEVDEALREVIETEQAALDESDDPFHQAARHALSLTAAVTDDTESCDTPSSGTEYVTDVVIRTADHAVDSRLILAQHREAIIIAVRIGRGVGVDQLVVIGHKLHADRDIILVYTANPIHGRGNGRHGELDRTAMIGGIFTRTGDCQFVRSQLATMGEQG